MRWLRKSLLGLVPVKRSASVDDPKRLQAIVTAANNMGHQANAKLSKIDNRYKDKQAIEHTGPMVIGWEQQPIAVDDLRDAVLDVAVLLLIGDCTLSRTDRKTAISLTYHPQAQGEQRLQPTRQGARRTL